MRTEKSRLKRSLLSLQELMRRIRHYKISDQASEINIVLRGHYAVVR
jgi:RNA-directed DNA polymerase